MRGARVDPHGSAEPERRAIVVVDTYDVKPALVGVLMTLFVVALGWAGAAVVRSGEDARYATARLRVDLPAAPEAPTTTELATRSTQSVDGGSTGEANPASAARPHETASAVASAATADPDGARGTAPGSAPDARRPAGAHEAERGALPQARPLARTAEPASDPSSPPVSAAPPRPADTPHLGGPGVDMVRQPAPPASPSGVLAAGTSGAVSAIVGPDVTIAPPDIDLSAEPAPRQSAPTAGPSDPTTTTAAAPAADAADGAAADPASDPPAPASPASPGASPASPPGQPQPLDGIARAALADLDAILDGLRRG